MDDETLSVMDCNGIRKLTIREGLRLFGFPENYNINTNHKVAFDLLGNTIVVPVIEKITEEIIKTNLFE